MLVRLRPGSSAPDFDFEVKTRLVSIREIYSGNVRLRLTLILAAAGLLLLTACSNIANLFLARIAARTNEFAVRVALGAGITRILSQILAETMLLSALGGALGVGIAIFGGELLATKAPNDLRLVENSWLSLPVLLFSIGASLLTGLLCAAVPVLQIYRENAASGLRSESRTTTGNAGATRYRQILIAAQMSLATALLASSGLLLHSFLRIWEADRGYHVEGCSR